MRPIAYLPNHKHPLSRAVSFALLSLSLSTTGFAVQAEEDNKTVALDTIVVTGQKFDRSLQQTKNSVAVVTNDDIENYTIGNVSDVFDTIPNTNGTLSGGFNIRGIDAFNVSGGGNSFLASMYFDGAPMPYWVIAKNAFSLWDVSQVEVFRGPQSTIQGRNALAGAVIIRSNDPSYESSAKLQAVVGDNGQEEYAFAGGGALIEDQLAVRIAAETKDFDGYNYNITRNEHSDFRNSDNYRAKVLFEPKALEGFSSLFTYTHNENELGALWSNTAKAGGNRDVSFNSPYEETTTTDIYTLEMSYPINGIWALDSITTYNETDYNYLSDTDFSAEDLSANHLKQGHDTTSQELRLTFDYGPLTGVTGLYYSNLDVTEDLSGRRAMSLEALGVPDLLVAPTESGGIGLPQALADQVLALYAPANPVLLGTSTDLSQKVESMAFFTDITYAINEHWDVLAGIRYDKEKQENASSSLVTINNADQLPDPGDYAQTIPALVPLLAGINQSFIDQAAAASENAPAVDKTFHAWLPKLGATYNFNNNASLTALYQKGYRSGGVGVNIARSDVYNYDQEYTDNYELALRTVWLDGSLVVNSNLFYLDWEDQQVSVQLSGNQFDRETVNSGASTVRGFETEVFYYPTPALTITAGVGYAKSEFDTFLYAFSDQVRDLSGRSFEDAPEKTANIAVNYDFDSGVFINVNANYASSSQAYLDPEVFLSDFDPATDSDPENDARTLVNLQLGYEYKNYKAFVSVRNALDEEYIERYRNETRPEMNLGEPRQTSLTLQANF
ncbi:TonB-dependent receptor [Bacterioplanoides sp. SCSIO 12839]|uniref:TonB-dependent receptor n=1 Tax=Bacterioplanoides sp. SCSIO 12839 TaxID=2829569 RepID=UPI00210539A4|nr:TonB-dependent receptor [Bacterioplanoides sp. SCSIO 12839]UTW47714.1 TonB-dependent receptor [Bacterioplanoides sp. SCSIO 12839]